jgi:hypothetical protein
MAVTVAPGTVLTTDAPVKLWRAGARTGLLAAAATTALAGGASAAGVSLEVGGEAIPLAGFAQMTLLCVAVGVVLAAAVRRWAAAPRRTFTVATVALTAASLGPDLAVSASTATRAVLMATHLVAAAIVIPALASRLPECSS